MVKLSILGGGGFRVPLVYRVLAGGRAGGPAAGADGELVDELMLQDTDPGRLDAIARVLADLPLPEGLSQAIAMCLRKRAAERPPNSRELEKQLLAIPLDGLPTEYPTEVPRHSSDAPSSRSLPR